MTRRLSRLSIVLLAFSVLCMHTISAQIAPGVLQSAAQTATINGVVKQSDGTPVVGADVQLIGPTTLVTKSDVHGIFTFISVPYGTYRIVATTRNLGTASQDKIAVKGDILVTIQYVEQSNEGGLKTIARVSTQSSGAQINVTPASITSINPTEYGFQGNTSWKQLLNTIPGVTVNGNLLGGGSSDEIIPGSPINEVTLSIDGALPYETSTTLDGMPIVNGSFGTNPGTGTQLKFLPLPTFETADIVRGPGANAPSIVDSIGGSFVLHAPGRVDKNQFELSLSNDPYGGTVANAKAALHAGPLSATIVYGLNTSPGPVQQNGISEDFLPILAVNGNTFDGCSTDGVSVNVACSSQVANTATFQQCFCTFQNSLLIGGNNVSIPTGWKMHDGSIGISYAIRPSVTAQVFYVGSSSEVPQPSFQVPVNFSPGPGYSGNISPGFNSSRGFFEDAGTQFVTQAMSLLEERVTANIGRGVLRLAALQDNSFAVLSRPQTNPPGVYNVWGTGFVAGTYTVFNGIPQNLTPLTESVTQLSRVNNRDLLGSYSIQVGASSNVGISYNTSYYNFSNVLDASIPAFGLKLHLQTIPPGTSATTNEFRLNANTQIASNISVDASWYIARGLYHVPNPSVVGAFTDATFPYSAPRVGVVWRANRDTAVRFAAGGGFALPSVQQLVGTNNFVTCLATCTVTLTNLNLRPETSFGFDLGTDVRLRQNTVLAFDVYRTNLYGQFFQTSTVGTFSGAGCGVPPCTLFTTQINNLQQSRYEGINLEIRHELPKGFYWSGGLGLTRSYVVSLPAGFYNQASCPNTPCVNTYIIPGPNFSAGSGTSGIATVPYASASAQLGYRWSPEKYIALSPTYYGNNNAYFEPAFVELDAQAGYPLTKNVSLLAIFRNITGIYGQNYAQFIPTLGTPTVAGQPFADFGIPYGPRSVTVTLNFKS